MCVRNVSTLLLVRTSAQEALSHVCHLHFHLHKDLEDKKSKILTLHVRILRDFLSGPESPW